MEDMKILNEKTIGDIQYRIVKENDKFYIHSKGDWSVSYVDRLVEPNSDEVSQVKYEYDSYEEVKEMFDKAFRER